MISTHFFNHVALCTHALALQALAPTTSLLFLTAAASLARTASVSSQLIQASVMLTPYLRPALPSLGTFWLPKIKSVSYSCEMGPRQSKEKKKVG